MSAPPPYNQTTNFAQDEANNVAGRSTVRTAQVDVEFQNLKATLDSVLLNRAIIQRDDGEIMDEKVGVIQLDSHVRAIIAVGEEGKVEPWAAGHTYHPGDAVGYGVDAFLCVLPHVATNFWLDVAAGNWVAIGLDPISATLHASLVAFTPTGSISSTNVQAAIMEVVSDIAAGGGGGGTLTIADDEPSVPKGGQWFESDEGGLYLRYQNPDNSLTWVMTNAAMAGDYLPSSMLGVPNGIAQLDGNGQVPPWQLPAGGGSGTGGQGSPFPDGSVSAPSIAYANEPGLGWYRPSGNVNAMATGGVKVYDFSAAATQSILSVYPRNTGTGSIQMFGSAPGAAGPLLLIQSEQNRALIYSTAVSGGSAQPIQYHAPSHGFYGSVAFNNGTTGITAAQVGLDQLGNGRQIYNLRGISNNIYIGWAGTTLDVQIDNSYRGDQWPINITGTAGNSNAVNGVSGWNYNNRQKNPVYIWATDGGTNDQYLTQPGYLRVDYANYANSAGSAPLPGSPTISGRLTVNHGDNGAPYEYANSSIVINGNAPSIGLHNPGITGWKLVPVNNDFVIGGNSNQGPSSTGGGAIQLSQNANCYARAFNSTGLRSASPQPLDNALEGLLRLHGVLGVDMDTGELDMGLDTDETEREFPAVVRATFKADGTVQGKGINYAGLTAPIIEAIRELNTRLTALENQELIVRVGKDRR